MKRTLSLGQVILVVAALSAVWIGSSLALAQIEPGSYAELVKEPRTALIRLLLPMLLAGIAALGFLATTGRLRSVWTEPSELRTTDRLITAGAAISIVVAIAGIVRGAMRINDGKLSLVLAILVATMAVGFTEELIFRGFVLLEVRKYKTELWAFVICEVLFGLWHLPNFFLGATLMEALAQVVISGALGGVCLYCVRRRTGSLWIAMLMHGLWDFAVLG